MRDKLYNAVKGALPESIMLEIIFVDDDQDDLFLLKKALNEIVEEVAIYYARCGMDLLYLLGQRFPDYLVMDINMPSQSGLECLKMLRSQRKYDSIPIVIYSTAGDDALIAKCYKAKANYFVIKPRSYAQVITVIQKILSLDWQSKKIVSMSEFVIAERK